MAESRVLEERLAGNTDTSFLKLVALVSMLVDHLGARVYVTLPEMRVIGRIALPLYAWCLVVGSVKTRSLPRYTLRMLGLALVSQPLYMLALHHQWQDLSILFLLLIALVAILGIRARRYGSEVWAPLLCYVLLGFVKVDYGWKGLTFILLLYLMRGSRRGLTLCFLTYAMFWGSSSGAISQLFGFRLDFLKWPGIGEVLAPFFRIQGMVWLALPLIVLPTHTGIRLPRWLGYAIYPLHLVVLVIWQLCSGVPFSTMLQGF